MQTIDELRERIEAKEAKIVVIGLGYVGLPLAILASYDGFGGFKVWGLDCNETRVGMVSAGDWPLDANEPRLPAMLKETVDAGDLSATTDYAVCQDADVVVICVPTPVNEHKDPDYQALWNATIELSSYVKSGALVIIESTLAPYTTEDIAQILPPSILLAHCPERVAPGCLLHNLAYLPRIIGGYTAEASHLAQVFYRQFCNGDLHVTDCLTAEISKTFENAYRDVQIALANELALICQDLGANVWEVRRLVNSCPGRDVLRPGPGVGGACLTKDSWLLASALSEPPELLLTSRAINDAMPSRVVDLVLGTLREAKIPQADAIVTILGVAYREGTSDVRGSPAIKVMNRLIRAGCDVRFYDPHVDGYDGDLVQSLTDADAAVIVTPHQEFDNLNWRNLGMVMRTKVLVDTRGMVAQGPEGFVFRGLGQ